MERQQRRRAAERPELSAEARRVADRLQDLTVDEAERVLERAIALETQAPGEGPSEVVTAAMLERIAAELDIDRAHLRQALLEELLRVESDTPGLLDRLLVPRQIAARGVASGTPEEVRRAADLWLGKHEGLRKRAENPVRTRWEKDPSIAAKARMAFRMSQGTKTLRSTAGVASSVRPIEDTRQLVAVTADTSNLRRLALGLLVAAAGVGALAVSGSVIDDPSGFGLDNLVNPVVVTTVMSGGIVIGFKMWAQRVREAVGRAVDAISSPHLVEETETVPRLLRRWADQWRRPGGGARGGLHR